MARSNLCVPVHPQREAHNSQISTLTERLSEATADLDSIKAGKAEADKEQEDLLVFLEELSGKRRRDKKIMREKGMDVSDDEDADGAGDESDEEE